MRSARLQSRRQTWLGAMLVALLGLAAWLSTVAIDGLPWASPYQVRLELPQGGPVLHAGDEVRIGGEPAGQVQSVSLAPGSRRRAVATLSLDQGFRVGAGASARVRPRGLAGAVYVDLDPGNLARAHASRALISATGGVQITDVISGFDAQARRALRQVLTGYGTGLAGRGITLGRVLQDAPPLLVDSGKVLGALRPEPGALAGVIGGARTVAGALSTPRRLPQLVSLATAVVGATGSGARNIAAAIRALPGLERTGATVLPDADRLLSALTRTSRALRPGISALDAALPSLQSIERSGPDVSVLAQIADPARSALHALVPALVELVGPASGLRPLSSPIARLASVLIPDRTELIQAPLGFTRWGNFRYDFGTGAGHRAVRFSMVLTCALARDPYPRPGAAIKERKPCPS
ncbi:MAG: MlaD family protein [Solirubrobacteraceae bacterium]